MSGPLSSFLPAVDWADSSWEGPWAYILVTGIIGSSTVSLLLALRRRHLDRKETEPARASGATQDLPRNAARRIIIAALSTLVGTNLAVVGMVRDSNRYLTVAGLAFFISVTWQQIETERVRSQLLAIPRRPMPLITPQTVPLSPEGWQAISTQAGLTPRSGRNLYGLLLGGFFLPALVAIALTQVSIGP